LANVIKGDGMPPVKRCNKWRFKVSENGRRVWKTFDSYEEAFKAYDGYIKKNKTMMHDVQEVEVVSIEETLDTDMLWRYVEENQHVKRLDIPQIYLPNRPFAIVFLSDLHIGSSGVDYRQAKTDAETVKNTPNMYAVFHGDGIDNWIIPKMAGLQRGQLIPFDREIALFKAWLCTLDEKLIAVVAGNHDNWTTRMSGIDWLKDVVAPTALYNSQEMIFDLNFGDNSIRICVRHKWRGTSIHNPTHGIERASKDIDADVYVGGHTHIGTLFRSFVVRQKYRIAVLTGTYKQNDSYALELNVPECMHPGSGAVIIDTDGSMTWTQNIQEAARYVAFKNAELNVE
jgi:predicted MPP superfamily phosphohydrolase